MYSAGLSQRRLVQHLPLTTFQNGSDAPDQSGDLTFGGVTSVLSRNLSIKSIKTMAPTNLTETEKRSCILLSDLFLNATFGDEAFDKMAEQLCGLGITTDAAYHVLYNDLYPVLSWNLVNPAAESFTFDPAWICTKVAERRRGKQPFMYQALVAVEWPLFSSIIEPQWKEIETR